MLVWNRSPEGPIDPDAWQSTEYTGELGGCDHASLSAERSARDSVASIIQKRFDGTRLTRENSREWTFVLEFLEWTVEPHADSLIVSERLVCKFENVHDGEEPRLNPPPVRSFVKSCVLDLHRIGQPAERDAQVVSHTPGIDSPGLCIVQFRQRHIQNTSPRGRSNS
jgi:hypothetical protein